MLRPAAAAARAAARDPGSAHRVSMSFHGNLHTFGILDLIALLNQRRMTGVLTVVAQEGDRGFVFHEGDLVCATASEESRRLGSFMIRLGFLTPDELGTAAELRSLGPSHIGQKLVGAGRISTAQLNAAVRAQIFDVLNEIMAWREATFVFDDLPLPFAPPAGGLVSAPAVILEAAKRADDHRYARTLFPEGNVILHREKDAPDAASNDEEGEILGLVDSGFTVDRILLASSRGPRAAAEGLRDLLERGVIRKSSIKVTEACEPAGPDITHIAVAPHVPAAIFEIYSRPGTRQPGICGVLAQEPLLTAKVLRLLTLSNIKIEREDLTLQRLVQLLGPFQARCLLLPEAARNLYFPRSNYYWHDCWRHDQVCADICEKIALKIRYPFPGEAYLAGLLHNIGVYILFLNNPAAYRCVVGESFSRREHMETLEEKYFGITHTTLGGIYARKWQFPAMLRLAVREHHRPEAMASRPLLHMLNVAASVTAEFGYRVGYRTIDRRQFRASLDRIALNEKDLVALFAETQRKIIGAPLERERVAVS